MPLDAEAKENLVAALRELREATRSADVAIGALADGGWFLDEERAVNVSALLDKLYEARRRYDDALILTGLNPPHRD